MSESSLSRGFQQERADLIQKLGKTPYSWLHLEKLPQPRSGIARYVLIFGKSLGATPSSLKSLTVFITPPLTHPGYTTWVAAQTLFQHLTNPQIRRRLLNHLTLIFFLVGRTAEPGARSVNNARIPGLRSPGDIRNGDLLQAHSLGVRAWLRLFRQWKPAVVMELESAETANWRAQCLFGTAPDALLPAPLSILTHQLRSETRSVWQQHRVQVRAWFRLLNPASPGRGVITAPGRLSGPVPYSALNRALAFQWTWKGNPKEDHLSTRIWQTLDPWFDLLMQNRPKILQARRQARMITPGDPVIVHLPLSEQIRREATPFLLHTYAYDETLSPISGTVWVRYNKQQPRNYLVPRFTQSIITLKQPGISGYLIPPIFVRAIRALKRQGVQMKILHKAWTLRVIVHRLERIRWSIPPKTPVPTISSFQTQPRIRRLTYPAGSAYIPLNQTHRALIVTLLDPDSPYNLLYLGFFRNLFDPLPHVHQARLETIARQLLRTHPKLARGFLHRILNPHFAGNPRSRLDFFYRHLYRDPVSRHLYPVAEWVSAPHDRSPLPPS